MTIPADDAAKVRLRYLHQQHKTAQQIATEIGYTLWWVRKWANRLGLSLKVPKTTPHEANSPIDTDAQIYAQIHEYALEIGAASEVIVRKATPEELEEFANLKKPVKYQHVEGWTSIR